MSEPRTLPLLPLTNGVVLPSMVVSLSGRVTTSLNFVVFPAVLLCQWGQGKILDLWPRTATGYAPEGYAVAVLVFIALQVASLLWILLSPARPAIARPTQSAG